MRRPSSLLRLAAAVAVAAVGSLAGATGCSRGGDEATAPPSLPASGVATAAGVSGPPGSAGDTTMGSGGDAGSAAVPGSTPGGSPPGPAGSVDPARVAEVIRPAAELAGADQEERNCLDSSVHAELELDPGAIDRVGGLPDAVGQALSSCLPPAKLAAAVTDRLRHPEAGAGAGLGLSDEQADCVRGTLVAGDTGVSASFSGAVALNDPAAVAAAAGPIDAVCGTRLAVPTGG